MVLHFAGWNVLHLNARLRPLEVFRLIVAVLSQVPAICWIKVNDLLTTAHSLAEETTSRNGRKLGTIYLIFYSSLDFKLDPDVPLMYPSQKSRQYVRLNLYTWSWKLLLPNFWMHSFNFTKYFFIEKVRTWALSPKANINKVDGPSPIPLQYKVFRNFERHISIWMRSIWLPLNGHSLRLFSSGFW